MDLRPSAELPAGPPRVAASNQPRLLVVTVGKSLVLESPADIQRVSTVSEDIIEVVAINSRELILNGKGAGETSLIVWQTGGNRLMFDVSVQPPPVKPVKDEKLAKLVDGLQSEIRKELGDQDISVSYENKAVFLRGTVKDLTSAQRAAAIAEVFGKPVNLLRVATPPGAAQILLKVKFADVDRSMGSDFGINLLSTGATNTVGGISTQQYTPPTVTVNQSQGAANTSFSLSDALNLFLFRPDLNLGATIKMLQNQRVLQILAEPNLLTSDGKKASFLSGGEFPYPIVQSSAGSAPTVTIHVPRVRHPAGFHAHHHSARHDQPGCGSRGEFTGLHQRAGLPGVQYPGAQHAQDLHRGGTERWAEFCDRRLAR